jgi:glycosyltransferase involved in cell wall biosynthesis
MRILFVCPKTTFPIGGIKQIYRQVYILNQLGFDAYVVHQWYGQNIDWLNIDVPIIYNKNLFFSINNELNNSWLFKLQKSNLVQNLKKIFIALKLWPDLGKNQTEIDENDVLVFPEYYGNRIVDIYPFCKKVLYVQGWSFTFSNWSDSLPQDIKPSLSHIIVNSNYTLDYISLLWLKLDSSLIRHAIVEPFEFQNIKEKVICYTSRRLPSDSLQIVQILKERNNLSDWKIIDINEKTTAINTEDFAEILRKSAIFISFSETEGFGLPPAEAMKCGCIVIGYTGYGGRDYFKQEFSYPIEERNIVQFVKTIEDVALNYERPEIKIKGELASIFITKNFNEENEKEDILKCWNNILDKKS